MEDYTEAEPLDALVRRARIFLQGRPARTSATLRSKLRLAAKYAAASILVVALVSGSGFAVLALIPAAGATLLTIMAGLGGIILARYGWRLRSRLRSGEFRWGDDEDFDFDEIPDMPASSRFRQTITIRRQIASLADAKLAVDGLKMSEQQVINLSATPPALKAAVTNFLQGAVYASEGSMTELGPDVYLISPANVLIEIADQTSIRVPAQA